MAKIALRGVCDSKAIVALSTGLSGSDKSAILLGSIISFLATPEKCVMRAVENVLRGGS